MQLKMLLPAGLAAVISAVILIGRAVGLSLTMISILVLCLVLLGLVVLTIGLIRAQKRQKKFLEGVDKQGDDDFQVASVQKRQSIRELQEKWKVSIDHLKKSGLWQQADPLYHLPWYVIIGEPQSGKSTAIKNSGMEFPTGESVQGTGGTKNCDWWFSNKFILLDTAGRYTFDEGQEADKEEWLAFLKLIGKYRKRMPINGLILSLPLDSLMQKSQDQLRQDARKARQKIDQLSQELGLHFPVFLLVMKSDLINGFTEFFQNLPEDKLDEVLGWTSDQVSLEDPIATFETNFDKIHETIRKLRLSLLKDETRSENLQTVYFFPEEFRRLKQRLSCYVDVVFKSNPYFPAPFLRGLFFTSGTQVGTVISSLIQAIGLKGKLRTFDTSSETRTYFLKDFFSKIIVRDKDLSVLSQRRMVSEKRKRWSLFSVAGALFALLLAACTVSFILNLSQGSGILHTVKDYREFAYELAGGLDDFNENAYRLGTYVEKLEASRKKHFWKGWGLYQGNRYVEPLKRLFRHEFYGQCLKPTIDGMLHSIQNPLQAGQGHAVQDLTADIVTFGKYLNSLSQTLEGPQNQVRGKGLLVPLPAAAPAAAPAATPETEPKEGSPAVDVHLPLLASKPDPLLTLDLQDLERLIARYWKNKTPQSALHFQTNLKRYLEWAERPEVQNEYQTRKNEIQVDMIRRAFSWEEMYRHLQKLNLPPVELSQQYRRMTKLQEIHSRSVEAAFTKKVWEERVFPLLNMLRALGEDPNLPPAFRNEVRKDILLPLVDEYSNRYVEAWREFLSYNVVPSLRPGSHDAVVWTMELQALEPINLAFENTRIDPVEGHADTFRAFQEAQQPFQLLHQFKQEETERQYKERIMEIFNDWDLIVNNPDEELRWAKARAFLFPALSSESEAEGNPLRKAEQWINSLVPEKDDSLSAMQIRKALMLPIVTARSTLFDEYVQFINEQWGRVIFETFGNKFHNKFPFMSNRAFRSSVNTVDVRPEHIRRFFGRENGILFSFVKEHLSLFMKQTRQGYEPKPNPDFPVNIENSFFTFLNKSLAVSRFFLDDQDAFITHDIALTTRPSNVIPKRDDRRSNIFVTESRLCIKCSEEFHGCLKYWDGPPSISSGDGPWKKEKARILSSGCRNGTHSPGRRGGSAGSKTGKTSSSRMTNGAC